MSILLYAFPWERTSIWILTVSLVLLLLYIVSRKIRAKWMKGIPEGEKYCILYPLETEPVSAEIEIYFTSEEMKKVRLVILNQELEEIKELVDKEFSLGGNIVRFNTEELEDGTYFYCLMTNNQKTMKKMLIRNDSMTR